MPIDLLTELEQKLEEARTRAANAEERRDIWAAASADMWRRIERDRSELDRVKNELAALQLSPAQCPRCKRADLTVASLPIHERSCMSQTDEDVLRHECESLADELQALSVERDDWQGICGKQSETIGKLLAHMPVVVKERDDARAELARLRDPDVLSEEQAQTKRMLEVITKERNEAQEDCIHWRAAFKGLTETVEKLSEKRDKLQQDLTAISRDRDLWKDRASTAVQDHADAYKERDELQVAYTRLEEVMEESLRELRLQRDDARAQRDEISRDCEDLAARLEQKSKELKESEDRINATISNRDQILAESAARATQVEQLKKLPWDLSVMLQDAQAKLEYATNHNKNTVAEMEWLLKQNNAMSRDLGAARKQLKKLVEMISELQLAPTLVSDS